MASTTILPTFTAALAAADVEECTHLTRNDLIEGVRFDYQPSWRSHGTVHVAQEPYPATSAECIDDSMRYKRATIAAVKAFAESKPYRGSQVSRAKKFMALHRVLCDIYGIYPSLGFGRTIDSGTSSGCSNFRPAENHITLEGKLSVITYLHEFGHAMGRGERGTCRWSLNLFKRLFPRSFATAFNGSTSHFLGA